ncbi:HCP-like protein [Saccharata proteae CBS 121410]|uniref:HCP-like protein n=1 Tax=Saccharata proteae CBS 121410 TaxID=1314787 RepID=A0A9P4HRB4_9PEZI|nr:HCP-like protein [Saccharata proteae CBS 121410]
MAAYDHHPAYQQPARPYYRDNPQYNGHDQAQDAYSYAYDGYNDYNDYNDYNGYQDGYQDPNYAYAPQPGPPAIEADMPDFDNEGPPVPTHRRGNSIDKHLNSPSRSAFPTGGPQGQAAELYEDRGRTNFSHQAHRSRSQPDFKRSQNGSHANGYIAEMPADVPDMPQLPRNNTGGQGYMSYGQAGAMSKGPMPTNFPAGPNYNNPQTPDSLPHHPTPVRAGLIEQQAQIPSPQNSKPPPVRNYNADPSPVQGGGPVAPPDASAPIKREKRRGSNPITPDELNKLRAAAQSKKSDSALQLRLAKKLIEAGSILSDEGGRADPKTKAKNREKYHLEAYKIVKKLVSHNYPEAMFYLADAGYGGGAFGLVPDTKEAFSLYQSAAKLGHSPSAYRTAVCCEMGAEEGGGTRRDPGKAVQWYKRAASLGDVAAMYKMGMILLKGLLNQQKNMSEAITWLKRAADRADEENPHALHELGLLYEAKTTNRDNDKVVKDEQYALSLFMQAAKLGYKFSQFRLGEAYEYGLLGCPVSARESIMWYTRAAAQGEHQSELALSGWYLTGSEGILEQSDTEAYLWARKAACADPPLPKAMFAMGYFTEVGIGCPRALEEAKKWYGRAASYKFPKAQERLEELKKGGVKVQRNRERLSRSDQKQHEENCVVM